MSTTHADEEEVLDPRIQKELDNLNQYSSEINRLENEIDEARSQYRSTFAESSKSMEQMGRKIKKQIQRARQYYEIKEAAVTAQSEVLRSARQFQTATGIYRAAKETIALAEEKLIDSQGNQSSAAMLTTAWQEMLNHAYIRVMEAEKEKSLSEKEHLRRSQVFVELESKLQTLERKFKTSIAKARPYFEMKAQCELKLKQQKQNVYDLQQAIASAKLKYADALTRLEHISEEIHESRRQKILLMFPREPGVGADSDSLCSSTSETCIEKTLFPSMMSKNDADRKADSPFSSDQDDDSVFRVKRSLSDPCAGSVTTTEFSNKREKNSFSNSPTKDNKCTRNDETPRLRSSGSGSSVQENVQHDSVKDQNVDDSSRDCGANNIKYMRTSTLSSDHKENKELHVNISHEREPGSGSETHSLTSDIYSESKHSDTEVYREQIGLSREETVSENDSKTVKADFNELSDTDSTSDIICIKL